MSQSCYIRIDYTKQARFLIASVVILWNIFFFSFAWLAAMAGSLLWQNSFLPNAVSTILCVNTLRPLGKHERTPILAKRISDIQEMKNKP